MFHIRICLLIEVGVAQQAEHRIVVPAVVGSIPITHPTPSRGREKSQISILGSELPIQSSGPKERMGLRPSLPLFFPVVVRLEPKLIFETLINVKRDRADRTVDDCLRQPENELLIPEMGV